LLIKPDVLPVVKPLHLVQSLSVQSQQPLEAQTQAQTQTQTQAEDSVALPSGIPNAETALQWQTLYVLMLSLCLVFWLRKDSLEQYWQQTRHQTLGLVTLIDHPFWQKGSQLSRGWKICLRRSSKQHRT